MGSRILIAVYLFHFILLMPSLSFCYEIKTRYATITYEKKEHLHKFNDKLYLGCLKYLLKKRRALTIEDEVKCKIDLIVEKAETVLEIFPNALKFKINLVPSPTEVQKAYYNIYGKKVNYIAFYSPGKNTVFYSVKHARIRVVSHEIGHVIVQHYFKITPPVTIHELLAQFTETHICD